MWPVQLVFSFLLYVDCLFPPGLCKNLLIFHLPLVFVNRLSRKWNSVVVFWILEELVPQTIWCHWQATHHYKHRMQLSCYALQLHVNFCFRLFFIIEACVLCVSYLIVGWRSDTNPCQNPFFLILLRKHRACISSPQFRFNP